VSLEEMSDSEESFRSLDKKMDKIGSKLDLLTQRLELYDVVQIKKNQDEMRQSIASLDTAVKAGGAVALIVLGAVVALVFKVFAG